MRILCGVTGLSFLATALVVRAQPPAPSASAPSVKSATEARDLLDEYCVICHDKTQKTANLMLDQMDLAHIEKAPQVWEKVGRKLRAGMMPPAGMPRPDAATYEGLIQFLETGLGRHKLTNFPPPGIHRTDEVASGARGRS